MTSEVELDRGIEIAGVAEIEEEADKESREPAAAPVESKLPVSEEEGTQEKENEIIPQSQPQSQSQQQRAKGGFQPPLVSKVLKLIHRPSKLTKQDVTCPICWSVLYEPTTLPCNHSLCTSCFLKHVDETSLYCPCCRRRLSVWSRKARKKNELIDEELWTMIKNEFPELVEARANGLDSPTSSPTSSAHFESLSQISVAGETSCSGSQRVVRDAVFAVAPGEIFKELKEIMIPHEMDIQSQREQQDAASVDLIQKLQMEEPPLVVQQSNEQDDLILAHKLQEQFDNEEIPCKATRLSVGTVKSRCVRNLFEDFTDCPLTPSEDEGFSSPEVKRKMKVKPKANKKTKSHKKKNTGQDNQKPAKKAKAEATVTSGALDQGEDIGTTDGSSSQCHSTAPPVDDAEEENVERFTFSPFSVKLRLHTADYAPDSAEKKFPSLPPINSQNEAEEVLIGEDEYFFLEKEARMLEAMRRKVEQEEADRALAAKLQESYNKGIDNPRGRHCLDEYSLRNWRKMRKQ